jgi:hypothetical protein
MDSAGCAELTPVGLGVSRYELSEVGVDQGLSAGRKEHVEPALTELYLIPRFSIQSGA